MKGAGFFGRKAKQVGTRLKKAAKGTHKVLTYGSHTNSPTTPKKAKYLGSLTSTVTLPFRYAGKIIENGVKGIGRMGALTMTRSGKAKKLIRQVTGITNYDKLKRKATKINTKTKRYQEEIDKIQREIINTTLVPKKGHLGKEGNEDAEGNLKDKREDKIRKLQAKIEYQDLKSEKISDKWKEVLRKKRKIKSGEDSYQFKNEADIAKFNSQGNPITRVIGINPDGTDKVVQETRKRTVSEQLAEAEKHFAEQSRKVTQQSLNVVSEKKAAFDEKMEDYREAIGAIKEEQNTISEYKNLIKEQSAIFNRKSSSEEDKKIALENISDYNEKINSAREEIKSLQKEQLAPALKEMKSREFKEIRQEYDAARKDYIKRSGKAQDLSNLVSRSKESISKSLERALTTPSIFEKIDRKITRKSKLYKNANITKPSESQKRSQDWIVNYWSKQETGRPDELERLKVKGEAYLEANGKKKQKSKDGTFETMTLRDIIEKRLPKTKTIETMNNKDFANLINKLEEEGKITVKEHDVLKKYHTAIRIQKMITESNITKKKLSVEDSINKLEDIRFDEEIQNYRTKEAGPLKRGMIEAINDDGRPTGEVDMEKLEKVVKFEFNEEKKVKDLAIENIKKTKDPRQRALMIKNLYKKYNVVMPQLNKIKIDNFASIFNDNVILDHVKTNDLLFDQEMKDELDVFNSPVKTKAPEPAPAPAPAPKFRIELDTIKDIPFITPIGKLYKTAAVRIAKFNKEKNDFQNILETGNVIAKEQLVNTGFAIKDGDNYTLKNDEALYSKIFPNPEMGTHYKTIQMMQKFQTRIGDNYTIKENEYNQNRELWDTLPAGSEQQINLGLKLEEDSKILDNMENEYQRMDKTNALLGVQNNPDLGV